MGKNNLITAFNITLFVAVLWVISPLNALSQKRSNINNKGFLNDVSIILSTSCLGCHENGGKKMAMSVWNFNMWETYSAQKQSKKAKKICNAITKGEMPPTSGKKTNSEMIPTMSQKKQSAIGPTPLMENNIV
jgi:hypothetical protein